MILLRIFEDEALKAALEQFFEAQATIEMASAAECMGFDVPATDRARKHACLAKAYEEAMNRLREYAHKQV